MSQVLLNIPADSRFIYPHVVNKQWDIDQTNTASFGIVISDIYDGISGSYVYSSTGTDLGPLNTDGSYKFLLYKTMEAAYYTNDISRQEFNLLPLQSRARIISIPQNIFGESIKPTTLSLIDNSNGITILDDGNGNLNAANTVTFAIGLVSTTYTSGSQIGNVWYETGIIALSDTGSVSYAFNNSFNIHFKNIHTVYEHEYLITIPATELNSTQKTVATASSNDPSFAPYITTIGLYDEESNLVSIAKLGKAIKKPNNLDLNFDIRFDSN